VSRSTLREAPDGYGWRTPIPLADVAPGKYVLRMEIRSRQRSGIDEVREVPLVVRPAAR
jgi:hypothetical protein